ncbi:MAG TPA: hypothetical protein PK283_03740 [Thiotrichales bacterium]|nr:hypothetical protein [Thiotrichales bacterium]
MKWSKRQKKRNKPFSRAQSMLLLSVQPILPIPTWSNTFYSQGEQGYNDYPML